jgi:CD80-like C2-set immunoglobulin domain
MKINDGEKILRGVNNVTCIAQEGRPAANISWYLNDSYLGNGKISLFDSVRETDNVWAVKSEIPIELGPEDEGKYLICNASHLGYPTGHQLTQQKIVFDPEPTGEICFKYIKSIFNFITFPSYSRLHFDHNNGDHRTYHYFPCDSFGTLQEKWESKIVSK